MPKFLDYHAQMPPLPPEVMQKAKEGIGQTDPLGVKRLNGFFSTTGQAWCFSEAADADAVCKSHEAIGIPLGKSEVHEVQTLA